jgi:hypothetical protein
MWPLFLAIALAPIIAGLAWWLTRADRLNVEALARVATARGWTLSQGEDAGAERYTLSPREGGWTLTVTRRKPSSSARSSRSGGISTTWRAPAGRLGGPTLVARPGARPTGAYAPPPALLFGLFERALGELGVVAPSGALAPLDPQEPAFDAQVTVLADTPRLALGPELRTAIQRAAALGAMVVISGGMVQLSHKGQPDTAAIDALIAAGLAVTAGSRPA